MTISVNLGGGLINTVRLWSPWISTIVPLWWSGMCASKRGGGHSLLWGLLEEDEREVVVLIILVNGVKGEVSRIIMFRRFCSIYLDSEFDKEYIMAVCIMVHHANVHVALLRIPLRRFIQQRVCHTPKPGTWLALTMPNLHRCKSKFL